jgi:hypothetical protein
VLDVIRSHDRRQEGRPSAIHADRSGVERSGRLVGVPSDTSCRVAELGTATEQDIGPRDSSCDHDQCGPSGVGATAERGGPRYGMNTLAV